MKGEILLRNKLKVARAEKDLSQAALAEMVGVSRNTISSIETGQFCPTAKLALILCIALDKKFEDLFFFEIEP
ncbi:MAG: helix-turn-helix transcriptional regulator [Defluviitaleaceae bacterium]|nr:helix-turn-helix transcriptional regulator [Defluviitaleaceae bacterium]